MLDFPIFVASSVLLSIVLTLVLMTIFGYVELIIFVLVAAFFISAASALWCAFSKNTFTEYAVWTMYLTGFALIVLMIRSSIAAKHPPAVLEDLKGPDTVL